MKKTVCILLTFVFFAVDFSVAQTRILFAGNSYTYYNDMPKMVEQIAKANALNAEIISSVNGGVSLKDHWEGNAGLQTKQWIENENFDFVVIQDQSLTPIRDPEMTWRYGKKLAALVEKQGGQIIIFQSWSRENNPESQVQLDQTFDELKKSSQGIIAPIADAWHLARAEYPNLRLYDEDGSHPSEVGSYLTALVFYLMMFEQKPEDFKTITSQNMALSDMKICEWIALQVALK